MKSFTDNQLYRLCVAQFLETIREPEVLFWGMVFPILISIGLGLAFMQQTETRFKVMVVAEHVAELDSLLRRHAVPGKNDRQSVWKIEDGTLGNTVFTFERTDRHSAVIALKRGEADMMVDDSLGRMHYHFDPFNSQAQLACTRLSALAHASTLPGETIRAHVSPLTLKGVRYIDFLVPGLIAFGIMADILWGVSYTIIERRSQKLLRRMVATPMRKTNLLIALMCVRIVMNVIDAAVIILAMRLIFGVEIQGNIGALAALFLAGNVAFTGIAVLISSRTDKTEVGNGWINAVQMPMMILSGVFFSYRNFPEWSIGVIKLLPLTALTDGFRSVFNEGGGWMEILMPSAVLTLVGVVCFGIGMRMFKWY
ncbi:MAG: ABC transporter permease [Tannerella sp.]|jgi:ABC-type multidrug transport system permease subunit|nr:ABC transporter permease [Tannerella sp.]